MEPDGSNGGSGVSSPRSGLNVSSACIGPLYLARPLYAGRVTRLTFEEILSIVCETANVGIEAANRTLPDVGLSDLQERYRYRAQLRQRLARRGIHVSNIEIPVDPEVTLRGIAQTLERSLSIPRPTAVSLRFGGAANVELPTYATRRVFFATDRKRTASAAPADVFGAERGDGSLTLGSCEVSIPRDHRMAALERPSIWRFEFRQNPEKHVVLLDVQPAGEAQFYADIAQRIGDGQAFVFVHGYHVSFEDAARRTGQLAYDLQFPGAPIFFSWPSFNSLPSYLADEAAVEWSVPHLRDFLATLHARTGAQRIHLIAHSMGNRALTRALEALGSSMPAPAFQQVVLTAPDIDRGVFVQMADSLRKAGERVTLYASTHDVALQASQRFHRGARAGESGADIVVLDGIDTVDASAVDTSFVGHSYFGGTRSVIGDIYTLLEKGDPPERRFGLEKTDLAGRCY